MLETIDVEIASEKSWKQHTKNSEIVIYERNVSYDDKNMDRDAKYIAIVKTEIYSIFSRTVIDDKIYDSLRGKITEEDNNTYLFKNRNERAKFDQKEIRDKISKEIYYMSRHGYEDYKYYNRTPDSEAIQKLEEYL
jgi:hypothetical protein